MLKQLVRKFSQWRDSRWHLHEWHPLVFGATGKFNKGKREKFLVEGTIEACKLCGLKRIVPDREDLRIVEVE